ncbi:MAG: RNA polymerase sigma factor [Oscillospiraceae bacterium]|jgi:RNA polymerase sigma-70 factor (ECF subfamily)|nr:RNA polymerase sigma factor [Bacillota bacterium]MBQ7436560.1 RNA polymerase sigma factor [Oscillospiraceae bacterium]
MDIEQQYDKLLRYCYMKLRDRTLAEDITQETFIRFFESKDYHSIGKEMAYLYTIARNLCIDSFRKQKDELIEDLPAKIQEMPESRDKVESIVDRVSIEQALDRLTADEREAVVLRFSGELSVEDIAKSMDISRFAVRRRILSALEKLRKEMERVEEF